MAPPPPERRLVVLPFADERDVRQAFGVGAGHEEHRATLRDAGRLLQAGLQKAVDSGGVPDGARVVLLLDEAVLGGEPLDTRPSDVEVVDTTDGLGIERDDTIVIGRTTWVPALVAWRDGELARGGAITRLALDITDFIQNYTKVA